MLKGIFLFLTFICTFTLHGVETSLKLPNPIDFDAESLTYFDVPLKELEEHADKYSEFLAEIKLKENGANNQEITSLISKINLSLQALINLKSKEDEAKVTYPAYRKNYSIENLIKLHHQARSKAIEIKNLEDQLKEKKNHLEAAQNSFDRQFESYSSLSSSSEDKIVSGLKTINNFLLLKLGAEDERRFSRGLLADSHELKYLKEEIAFAKQHLKVTSEEIAKLKNERSELEEKWRKIQADHRKKEADQIIESQKSEHVESDETTPQESLQYHLEELAAKENYLFSEVKLTLAQLVNDPDQVDLSKLKTSLQSWGQLLKSFQLLTKKWELNIQKATQRISQLISLENSEPQSSNEMLKLAQSNLLLLQGINNEIGDSEFLIDIIRSRSTPSESKLNLWWSSFYNLTTESLESFRSWLDTTLFHIGITPITILSFIKFLLVILLTILISRILIRSLTQYVLEKKHAEKASVYRLSRLLNYLILTVGFIVALSVLGFDFSSLLLIAGALGVGLGFGLQSIFNNFISGIIMLFESQLKIGDYIELSPDVRGEISAINFRSSIITTGDGIEVIVPNAEILNNKIINWTLKHPFRRFHIPFSVAYDSDPELVKSVVSRAAKNVPQTLSKHGFADPYVLLTKFSENSLEFELLVWVNERYAKERGINTSDYLIAIRKALQENNINLPYLQKDVSLQSILDVSSAKELKSLFSGK